MTRRFLYLMSSILILMAAQGCTSDPIEQGDKAFQEGKYAQAIKFYLEAKKEHAGGQELNEKIAIAYFKLGEDFYKKRKVLSAFNAKVNEGLQYLPDTLSEHSQKLLSDVHLSLARAYMNTQPENIIQKRQFYDNAQKHIQKALSYNPDNSAAQAEWQKFIEANFTEMYEKGKRYFKQGKKSKSDYLIAEFYLNRAVQLKPDHPEASKLLKEARKRSLNLLDMDQDLPFAITDRVKKENTLSFLIVLTNNTDQPHPVSAANFYLISKSGVAVKGYSSKMFKNSLTTGKLPSGKEKEGVVSFDIKPGETYVRIEYRLDDNVMGYKNLP